MTSKRSKNSSGASSGIRPVVILDFDETLIDTSAIKARFFRLVAEKLYSPEVTKEISAAFRPFHRENYLSLRRSVHKASRGIPALYGRALSGGDISFPGVREFLSRLARDHDLILLTYGYPPIQRRKIERSGLRRFFKKIIVTVSRSKEAELHSLSQKYPGAWVLDDESYVCAAARRTGLRAVQVKKGSKDRAYYVKLARKLLA